MAGPSARVAFAVALVMRWRRKLMALPLAKW
jgi:hypothetical protein